MLPTARERWGADNADNSPESEPVMVGDCTARAAR